MTDAPIELKRWLARLAVAVEGARADVDPEGVHRLRVALARIRVWLDLAGHRRLRDELRWLRGRAAEVRDGDVKLAQRPPPEFARRWLRRRARAHAKLITALDSDRTAALLGELAALPPLSPDDARRGVAALVERALRRGARAKRHPHDVDALHALRRTLRRLRYALEWRGAPALTLAPLQDALGEVCDRALALRGSRSGSRHERRYERRIARELRRALRETRGLWKQVRPALKQLRGRGVSPLTR